MREIKFRAMPTYKGGFVYGSLIKKRHTKLAEWMIEDENGLGSDVVTETIGQFTGLLDKNGKEIFEGDILKSEFVNCNFAIEWNNDVGCYDWYVLTETKKEGASLAKSIEQAPAKAKKTFSKIVEVIGNIYENPELLKP